MAIGIIFAFLAAIVFSIYFVLMKVAVKKSSDYKILTALMQLISGVMFIPLLFFETLKFDSSSKSMLLVTILFFVYAGAGLLRYGSNKKIEASLSIIISRVTFVVSFIGAILILGEAIYLNRLAGVLILLIGVSVLFVKNKNSKFLDRNGLFFAVGSAILYGIGQIIDGANSRNYSPALYSGLITGVIGIIITIALIIYGKRLKDFVLEFNVNFKMIILLALANTLSYFFMILSYQYIDKSMALPIINSTVALTVILSYFFLHERDHLVRKAISAAFIFAGIILVSLA